MAQVAKAIYILETEEKKNKTTTKKLSFLCLTNLAVACYSMRLQHTHKKKIEKMFASHDPHYILILLY